MVWVLTLIYVNLAITYVTMEANKWDSNTTFSNTSSAVNKPAGTVHEKQKPHDIETVYIGLTHFPSGGLYRIVLQS